MGTRPGERSPRLPGQGPGSWQDAEPEREDLMQGRQGTFSRTSTTIHHNLRNEAGQTLILFALSLVVLCGFLGLAIDVGVVRATKIKLQEAADAAALAGALEVNECDGATNCQAMQSAARAAMAENGLSGSALQAQVCSLAAPTTLTLTLNNGPCALANDPNSGNSQYVEAVVSKPQRAYFARVFGLNSFNVSARGVAMGSPAGCFYNLGKPGMGSLTLAHGAHLNATNCAIFDDGESDNKRRSPRTIDALRLLRNVEPGWRYSGSRSDAGAAGI